jgi:hypothetical protein
MIIMKKSKYFKLHELVCPHVLTRDGESAWRYLRPVVIDFLDWFKEEIGKPVYVNNYSWGGDKSQRGLRCNMCALVKGKITLYMSAHILGAGVDLNVKDMAPKEIRKWIESNIGKFFKKHPQYIAKARLEDDASAPTWVHVDFYEHDDNTIIKYVKG